MVKKIERSDEVIEKMTEKLRHFWHEHVMKYIPPPPSGDDLDTRILQSKWHPSAEEAIDLPSTCPSLCERYQAISAEEKTLKREKTEIKNQLIATMKNNKTGYCDGYRVSHTGYKTTRFDSTAFKTEHPNLYSTYSATHESHRLTVASM